MDARFFLSTFLLVYDIICTRDSNEWEVSVVPKIAVTMATLESHNHIVGDIERGVKIYNGDGVEFAEREPLNYFAHVPHKGDDLRGVAVNFTNDGQDDRTILLQ